MQQRLGRGPQAEAQLKARTPQGAPRREERQDMIAAAALAAAGGWSPGPARRLISWPTGPAGARGERVYELGGRPSPSWRRESKRAGPPP